MNINAANGARSRTAGTNAASSAASNGMPPKNPPKPVAKIVFVLTPAPSRKKPMPTNRPKNGIRM